MISIVYFFVILTYFFFLLGDKVVFEIDPKVNPTLRELLKRITPLCSHYSIVVSFVERHTLMGSGNLLKGIDNKTVRRYGISICLHMFSSQYHDVHKEIK